jgi:nitroreductase
MLDNTSPLTLRYGSGGAPAAAAPNPVIDLLLRHRSVRGFRPDPLPDGALELIIAAAQSAATSSNLQTWSVVHVTDPAAKATCAAFAGGQQHIADCPVFLLFVADLARLNRTGAAEGIPANGNDTFEMLMVATIDASLAAQNAVIAAESMGLSTVYIGGMRNRPEETAALIGLPPAAAVVFGLCIGYAREGAEGSIKPRLPQEAVLHRDHYDLDRQDAAIARYNAAMADFYARERMNVQGQWTRHSAKRVAGPDSLSGRHELMRALKRMAFLKAE